MLAVGTLAPNFELPDQNGHTIELAQFKGKQSVVLFFYPRDHTPGCTAQSCSFRDNYLGFKNLGAQVIGISADSVESHEGFASEYKLPYPILSDAAGSVAKQYGLKKTFGLIAPRVSFVIDKQGAIRYAYSSQLRASSHVDETLQAVQRMAV
jgi:peroxiredoxin Q/BCP